MTPAPDIAALRAECTWRLLSRAEAIAILDRIEALEKEREEVRSLFCRYFDAKTTVIDGKLDALQSKLEWGEALDSLRCLRDHRDALIAHVAALERVAAAADRYMRSQAHGLGSDERVNAHQSLAYHLSALTPAKVPSEPKAPGQQGDEA